MDEKTHWIGDKSYLKPLKKYLRSRIRSAMRGYRQLTKSNQGKLVRQIARTVFNTPLFENKKHIIPAFNQFNLELSLRQYLDKLFSLKFLFNQRIFHSVSSDKPFRYPMPLIWQKKLQKHIKVDRISCQILWVMLVISFWCYGVLKGLTYIYQLLIAKPKTKYVYFHQITNNSTHGGSAHTIINWYFSKWKNKSSDITEICHNSKNITNKKYQDKNISYIPELPALTIFKLLIFILLYICLSIFSLACLCIGKTQYALLLAELLKFFIVKLADKKYLASDYLFDNSTMNFRALWTYEAERKGSRVIVYFYSVHFDSRIDFRHWQLATWSHYLVWDTTFELFLSNHIDRSAHIEIVGPIWGTDVLDFSFEERFESAIAVFDIQSQRTYHYQCAALEIDTFESFTPKVVNPFLEDIHAVLSELGIDLIHKRKRNIPLLHRGYSHLLQQLNKKEHYYTINPDTSAFSLIKKTKATISAPFTSPSIIAKNEDKPSIYYDPIGLHDKNAPEAHGLKVLSGKKELREWVLNLSH